MAELIIIISFILLGFSIYWIFTYRERAFKRLAKKYKLRYTPVPFIYGYSVDGGDHGTRKLYGNINGKNILIKDVLVNSNLLSVGPPITLRKTLLYIQGNLVNKEGSATTLKDLLPFTGAFISIRKIEKFIESVKNS